MQRTAVGDDLDACSKKYFYSVSGPAGRTTAVN